MSEQENKASTSTEQPNGIQAIVEQASNTTQQNVSAAKTGAETQQTQSTTAQITPEQFAQLQAELTQTKESYKHLQSDYTKKTQALAQFLGSNPQQTPPDPYAPITAWAKQKGYDESQAKDIAEIATMVAQRQSQEAIQQYQYANAGNQIPIVMAQAYNLNPAVMSNEAVYKNVQQHMQELHRSGQFDLLNSPDYVLNFAKIQYADQLLNGQQTQQQAAPIQQGIPKMWGVPQSFQGVQNPQKQTLSPVAQKVSDDVQSYFKKAS